MNKNKKISKNYKKGGSTFDGQNFYATGGTTLTEAEEKKYQNWKKTLPKNLQYEGDYDLKGFWKENPKWSPNTPGSHMTDKYKLPNHPTFSDESQYFMNAPWMAGKWGYGYVDPGTSKATYTPYNTNYKQPVTETYPGYATGGYIPSYGELLDQYFKNGGMVPKLDFGGWMKAMPKPEPKPDPQPEPDSKPDPKPEPEPKPGEEKPGEGESDGTGEGEGDETTDSGSKNKKGPWMGMGYNLLNAGMMAGNYWNQMQQAGYNNMAMMSQGMTSAAAPRIEGNHGDYTLNSAAFRPDQYSYTTFAMGGSTVPMYEEGGIYDIDDSEINRLKSLGYTITPVK